jgi:hypothetical protein
LAAAREPRRADVPFVIGAGFVAPRPGETGYNIYRLDWCEEADWFRCDGAEAP